jgi:hypothetical protein
MFDENFSFLSSSSTHYDTIVDISPFASRSNSPTPQYHYRYSQSSSTQRRESRDSRFDAYRSGPRNPSIVALTQDFSNHTLAPDDGSASPSCYSPTYSNSADEGFFESPDTPSSASTADFPPSPESEPYLWAEDLNSPLTPTSSHRPSLSLEAQALSSYTQRRRQRQALVRLQCLAKRAPDLAMLLEECHPSALPVEMPMYAPTPRSGSTSAPSSSRVEKERSGSSSCVKRQVRMRKRATK